MWSVAFALLPKRYLYAVAAIAALFISGLVVYKRHVSGIKDTYFNKGYAVAHDSAVEATILRLVAQHAKDTLRAATSAKAAQDGTTVLTPQRAKFDSAQRHTPRLEALTVPVTADTNLVGVFVENTGEHFVLPRRAAMYWAASDSLVGVAQQLLKKYAAANAGWAGAWQSEHGARIGADSLVSLYAERLRSVTPVAKAAQHRLVYAAAGAILALIARKQIHR